MAENCCVSQIPTLILACAGGSNVGQLTNQAADFFWQLLIDKTNIRLFK